jgi:hypothetical protein
LETRLSIAATDPNVAVAETHVDGDPFAEDIGVDNDEHSELLDPPPRQCRPFNRQDMGGNQNHNNQHYEALARLEARPASTRAEALRGCRGYQRPQVVEGPLE